VIWDDYFLQVHYLHYVFTFEIEPITSSLSRSVSAPFCSFDKRVAMRGWRDADSHSPILSRVMPGDLFLQKNVFFSPDLLESVLEDKFHREKIFKNNPLGPRIFFHS